MEKIIIFGTGKRLGILFEKGYTKGLDIVALCDNDETKQGKIIRGLEVIPPKKLNEYEFDAIYISSQRYYEEIRQELETVWKINRDMIKPFLIKKYDAEMNYWKEVFSAEGGRFENGYYKQLMLGIAEQEDDEFLKDKVVADFGCGPRGSLRWTDKPLVKIGIDVLAKDYMDCFGEELAGHNMVYVTSSERRIPLPNGFVDCLFTINSLDHVDNLRQMADELLRILKQGGIFIASFNLNESWTECEPQTLTEDVIKELILDNFLIESYRLAYMDGKKNPYGHLFNNETIASLGEGREPAILWVKGIKK